ncbi:MAG TPA: histidine kinase dimerization/phospho-acceptor domain-containing protein, partial [Aggregatilineales bacterium]|nr:histidine kinase dimerization/phospho-acceptor domain-containing protein [Aggregatilineales bacterium]
LEPDDVIYRHLTGSGLQVIGISLSIVLVSFLTLLYLQIPGARYWLLLAGIWWVVLVTLTATDEVKLLGRDSWLTETFSPVYLPGFLAIFGWIGISAVALMQTFYSVYAAPLPEIANRAIFWVLTLPLVLMGAVLAATGSVGLIELGMIVQAAGMIGLTYAALSLRVLDVRQNMQRTAALGMLVVVSAITILIPLVIFINLNLENRTGEIAVAVVLAAVIAVPQVAFFNVFNRLMMRLGGQNADVAGGLHTFTQIISGVVELEELVDVTMQQLKSSLNARRGGLILLNNPGSNSDYLLLYPYHVGLSEIPSIEGKLRYNSPIYQILLKDRKPVLQFDIDYNAAMKTAHAEEKSFFKQMQMAVYTPVIAQGEAIGILCTGNKASDDPYSQQELDLLATLANQMGIALRNARLVDDLRRREKDAVDVNRVLQETKDRLEHLDEVKTDFITIASHELRTPLAQIRGYTDIIQALNDQGMLDPEQLSSMTGNLRKASDRMEELIRNMLDVSQLDVNAMDLRFTEVTV